MCWGLFVIVVGLLRHVYGFQNTKQLGKTHIQLMSLLKHIMLGGFWRGVYFILLYFFPVFSSITYIPFFPLFSVNMVAPLPHPYQCPPPLPKIRHSIFSRVNVWCRNNTLAGRTVNKVITDLNITFIRSSVRVKNSKYSWTVDFTDFSRHLLIKTYYKL